MQPTSPPSREPRNPIARVIAASTVGTALEWYEFFLYGLAASLVFGPLFFPTGDPLTTTLLSFSTFAIGFIARPIGALIAGHYGDKVGRKNILTITLLVMGTASFLIGCIPTYAAIGVWAPILLSVIRFIQGLALGGEWAGAVLLIAENTDSRHRGFFASLIQSSSPLGNVLATGAFAVLNLTLSDAAFLSYGWRIAFWLSAIVTLLGLYIRTRMAETPAFQRLKAERRVEQAPIATLLRLHWRTVLSCIGVRIGSDTAWTVFAVFSVVYITKELGLPRQYALNAALIGAAMQIVTHGLAGALSDRIGRRATATLGVIGMAAWLFVFFRILDQATPLSVIVAVAGGLLAHSLVYGPMAAWFVELFPSNVRFSGASISHQVASLAGGAIAPIIAISILSATGNTAYVVIYVLVALALGLIGAATLPETRARDLG
ncbi:MHS family MFS transporter [Achromobacter sp. Marseille-Q0513]|uniref:MFS transporter n=1 Tax=Achromobacter sp. Marseille-Q0513 TaxID=2829161 RepID=UPI001BA3AA65|nr:MFS transporter [Achromobacter sp. Marseille-Q0513]MBR8654532.1 MHS family MFS transporter [Achromobacter sp. Marseille-Q0513]